MRGNKFILLAILLTSLKIFGQSSTEIAKTGIKSTVSIVALDQFIQPLGYGSGFMIDDELVATNVHVIEGCNSAYILKNGEDKKYKVNGYVAIDKANDLVILKISELSGDKLNLGSENLPEIGEKIFAVGNPKGFNGTFSEGNISGIRDIQTNKVLQITAPISPGSSGGPVLNSLGLAIGIAFASFTDGQNINFAIPVKYLLSLKLKIGTVTSLSSVKSKVKTVSQTSASPLIKTGVTIRNIDPCFEWTRGTSKHCLPAKVFFSIKNNLPTAVFSIKILLLIYDKTGTIVSYQPKTLVIGNEVIQPFLARSFEMNMANNGEDLGFLYAEEAYVKIRVLDFIIQKE